MLNRFSRLAALSACILPMFFSCSDRTPAISNPLDIDFGDPYVLLAGDGRYYMYGTGIVKDGFCCYSSDNLADWIFINQDIVAVTISDSQDIKLIDDELARLYTACIS